MSRCDISDGNDHGGRMWRISSRICKRAVCEEHLGNAGKSNFRFYVCNAHADIYGIKTRKMNNRQCANGRLIGN